MPASSSTAAGASIATSKDSGSLFWMVSVTSSGFGMAGFDTTPDTVTTSGSSGSSSSTGRIVTVPVLPVAPAAKLSVRLVLSSNSSAVAGATGLAEISTVKGTGEAGDAVAVTVIGVASSRAASSLRCSVTSSPGGISCAWAVVGRASAPESASSAAAASPRAEPTSECRATRRRERPAGRPAADAACVQGEEPPPRRGDRRVRRRGRRSALGARRSALGIVRQAGAPTPSLLLRCPDAAPAQRSGGLPQTRCVSSLHLPGAMLQPPACQAAAPSTFPRFERRGSRSTAW